jgi:hypothetical protein
MTPSKPRQLYPITITARVNVSFGNNLVIFGNWNAKAPWITGIPMQCINADTWIATVFSHSPIEFKVRINGSFWEAGQNHKGYPNTHVIFSPDFTSLGLGMIPIETQPVTYRYKALLDILLKSIPTLKYSLSHYPSLEKAHYNTATWIDIAHSNLIIEVRQAQGYGLHISPESESIYGEGPSTVIQNVHEAVHVIQTMLHNEGYYEVIVDPDTEAKELYTSSNA